MAPHKNVQDAVARLTPDEKKEAKKAAREHYPRNLSLVHNALFH
jgi:hypothetical protein